MDKALWDKILQFDLDSPPGEYGFSTRLANENFWTTNFTDQAILEYKKFMYLAATSDLMVSPSEIVDTVWHLHLIFTQSYQEFCSIIGKQVQHIPSLHNRAEYTKFKQARERTTHLYTLAFGQQPGSIWDKAGMYESLNLEKAKFKIRSFLIAGILFFALLTVPAFFLLRPVYVHINNPYFVYGFIILTLITFATLETFNRKQLKQITARFDDDAFIYTLHPLELVYLKTQKLTQVIHGIVNELIQDDAIIINTDNTLQVAMQRNPGATEQQRQSLHVLNSLGCTYYPAFLNHLLAKPIFYNTSNCMDAFRKYFTKSKKFGRLFYLNFGILAILLLCGFTRIATGIFRERPVTILTVVLIILTAAVVAYLNRLPKLICTVTIPGIYRYDILPNQATTENWQWNYFLSGTPALTVSLLSLINYSDHNNNGDSNNGGGGSCGNSCGSSCGSSCSSCGGCGGGD